MPPAIIGGAIAGIGAIGASVIGSKASSKAVAAQTAAADQQTALQKQIYGQNAAALAPYRQAGTPATQQINAMLDLSGSIEGANLKFANYLKGSDYAFKLAEGENALNSGYAGAGTLQSGAAMKALEKYRQNLQQGYRGEYMGALGNQQAMGLSAASAQAGVGQNYADSLGQIYQNKVDAISNGALVQGQNTNALIGGLANIGAGIFGQQSASAAPYNPGGTEINNIQAFARRF